MLLPKVTHYPIALLGLTLLVVVLADGTALLLILFLFTTAPRVHKAWAHSASGVSICTFVLVKQVQCEPGKCFRTHA